MIRREEQHRERNELLCNNIYIYIYVCVLVLLLSLLLFFFNLQFTLCECECECAYYCGGALFRVARGTGTAHIIQRMIYIQYIILYYDISPI